MSEMGYIVRCAILHAQEKLQQVRPLNLGQASRVSGVSPADVAVLMVYLRQNGES